MQVGYAVADLTSKVAYGLFIHVIAVRNAETQGAGGMPGRLSAAEQEVGAVGTGHPGKGAASTGC